MRVAAIACVLGLLILPSLGLAQSYTPRSQTVLLPGEGDWRNYFNIADGPCGCSTPVRTDCYDEFCPGRCGCRPLCLLHKVSRMLNCLLPCNSCLGGCCCGGGYGCGGGAHCCVLGGRFGGCGACGDSCCGRGCGSCCTTSCVASSCCAPSCSAPSCSSGMPLPEPDTRPLPPVSDPFKDDPATPASPTSSKRGIETRWNPLLRAPLSATPTARDQATVPGISPWKTTSKATSGSEAPRAVAAPKPPSTIVVSAPTRTTSNNQSVLRKTSHEGEPVEPAPLNVELKASPIPVARSSVPAVADFEIPQNPLRR